MINEKDIYNHLKHGGDPQKLHDAFLEELNKVQKRIDEEAVAAQKKKELEEEKDNAKKNLLLAAQKYLALEGYRYSYNEIEKIFDTVVNHTHILNFLL